MKNMDKNALKNPGTWQPLNFDSLLKRLVDLKFACLQCTRSERKEIRIDLSDIRAKFDKLGFKSEVKRKGQSRSKGI